MLRIILTVVQVFSAFAIVALVLLQRGKGADAGAGFGAGASGTVFGARGASTALSRATAIFAAVFMVNSLALAYMGTKASEAPRTILDEAGDSATKPHTGAATIAPAASRPATPAPGSAPATAPGATASQVPPTPDASSKVTPAPKPAPAAPVQTTPPK